MKAEEYYKIAEKRIGEYDAHMFKCKQWLFAIVAGVVAGSFYRPKAFIYFSIAGSLGVLLVFVVEMAYQAVASRLGEYASLLEDRMASDTPQDVSDCEELGLSSAVSLSNAADWSDFFNCLKCMLFRVRALVPYLAGFVLVWAGPFIAAITSKYQGTPHQNPVTTTIPVVTQSSAAAWLTAFGTILVAFVAIWKDWIVARLLGPKLTIKLLEKELLGTQVKRASDVETWYYHLNVENKRPKTPAMNCRITMRRIQRQGQGGTFADLPVPTPLQFVWAHPNVTPPAVTISISKTLDLCFADEGNGLLHPELYSKPNNFDGAVKPGECLRYFLDIEADNFVSRKSQVFQVAWNGKWSKDRSEMASNVTITEVKAE